jgi:hypothetical protein
VRLREIVGHGDHRVIELVQQAAGQPTPGGADGDRLRPRQPAIHGRSGDARQASKRANGGQELPGFGGEQAAGVFQPDANLHAVDRDPVVVQQHLCQGQAGLVARARQLAQRVAERRRRNAPNRWRADGGGGVRGHGGNVRSGLGPVKHIHILS